MNKKLTFFFFLLLGPLSVVSQLGEASSFSPSICVIDFTKSEETNSFIIEDLLSQKGISYYKEARPKDLENCLLGDFYEVLIISHGFGYTKERKATDSEEQKLMVGPYSYYPQTLAKMTYWNPEKEKYSALRKDFFVDLEEKISKTSPLKSLRILTCYSSTVVFHYKLKSFSENLKIHLDMSPSLVWSFMPYTWLVESVQMLEGHLTENYTFLIPFSTVAFISYGSRVVLGGRYKVTLKGASLGLGKLWVPVNLPKKDLNSLSVGETRKYARKGFSFGWIGGEFSTYQGDFMKEEIQFYQKHIKAKSVNLGLSMDIASQVTVTRLQ